MSRSHRRRKRRVARIMVRPRLYLTQVELEGVRSLAERYEKDGARSPVGAAISELIGWGLFVARERTESDREMAEALESWDISPTPGA